MLKLTSKLYEIEEDVQVEDEQGNVIYSFKMQITPNELKDIRALLGRSATVKTENIDDMVKLGLEIQEEFEKICFKEHRETFRETVGEGKYLEMVETILDFFTIHFIEKQAQRMNTLSSHLKKIG